MSGYEEAKQKAGKLKEETETKEEQKELAQQEVKLALSEAYFTNNANVGLEDVTQEDMPVPSLALIQKTSRVTDDEGRPYAPGRFFYKTTKSVYEELEVAMLVFTKQDLPSFSDKTKLEHTYVFIGALENKMPFKMYLRGSAMGAARQFLGEVKARKMPMYSLRVQLTAVKRENDFGEYYVPQFQITGIRENPDEVVMLEELARQYNETRHTIQAESGEEVAKENIPF